MRTLKQALSKDYIDVPGYPKWAYIKRAITEVFESGAKSEFFESDRIARGLLSRLIRGLLAKDFTSVYYVPKSFFDDELHKRDLTDEAVKKFTLPVNSAFFVIPRGIFIEPESGAPINWIFYDSIEAGETRIDIPLFKTKTVISVLNEEGKPKIEWGSIAVAGPRKGRYYYFSTLEKDRFQDSLKASITPLSNEDKALTNAISKTLINILMYMDSEVVKDSPVGFQHKARSPNERTLLNPNWIKPRVVYVNRTSVGGSHASPIPHERREHLRRIRDAEGNVVKVVKVKASKVNMKDVPCAR